MPFRAELSYTREDMRQFETLHQKFRCKGLYYVSRAMMVLAGLIMIFCLIVLVLYWQVVNELRFYVLVLVLSVILWVVMKRIQRTAAWKSINAQGPVTMTAEEDRLHVEAGSMCMDVGYDSFADLVYYKNCYYLYIDKRKAQIIPERCFTQGDPAAFGAFISEKTGLEWKEIK